MTDQQNAALAPCPFCGGEAEQGRNADTCGEAVHCITCGAEGKQFHPTEYGYTFGDDAQAYVVAYEAAVSAATAAWNRRPAPAGAEAVREAYQRGLDMGHKNNALREELWFAHRDRLEAEIDRLQKAALATPQPAPTAEEGKDPVTGALVHDEPAPTAAEDGLREAAEAGYRLSTWAACVRWDGGRNEKDWLDGLRERIEKVQALAALRAKPEASTEKGE